MDRPHFWTTRRSTQLTLVACWIALGGALVCAVGLIPFLSWLRGTPPWSNLPDIGLAQMIIRTALPLYGQLAGGVMALILLLRLLLDIRREAIFTASNVTRLRAISWCGLAIMVFALIGVFTSPLRPVFALLALIAGFLGLVMRVVKNVIDNARELREDADYTI
ncbi:MAG: DUF2975 domain-containing protein [Propionibacteriaceae bacterium]|jgi:hypothetical protein|nr:DUF2975 domain-containing protein [Propionibacteriaceae bacterium]